MKEVFFRGIIGVFLFLSGFTQFKLEAQLVEKFVDLKTHKLFFSIIPGNEDVIIFEAGGGNFSSIWENIVGPIHESTGATIVTYDRSGYGQSELNPNLADNKKASIKTGTDDLYQGLKELGFDDNIIYVGHSYGGFYAQYFANTHPEKVKGLILIDANTSCFWNEAFMQKTIKERTEEWYANIKSLSLGLYYECLAMEETVQVMSNITIPSSIPVVDIVAEYPPNFEDGEDISRWHDCHEAFVEDHGNIEGVFARGCGHYVFMDDPKMVMELIVEKYFSWIE